MTTASPITASLATACAAHDRHRLDVLDALLDEAAPSAVRELLGAALDLCATLHARRDEMTAQLAEFRRDVSSGIAVAAQTHADEVSALRAAIDRYDSEATAVRNALRSAGVPEVVPYPPGDAIDDHERSLRAGGRAPRSPERIGMLAADLASERAHLAACQTRIAGLEQAANERSAEVARLTARVAELEARPVLTVEAAVAAAKSTGWSSSACRDAETVVGSILAALGPVTLPPAQDRADELARAIDRAAEEGSTIWSDATRRDRADITRAALASLGAPPTSTPVARPVFAGVSEDELIRLFYVVGTDGIDHGEQCPPIDSSDRNGIRAVLARLEVSLVAPVDLAAIERAVKAYHNASGEHAVPADALGTGQWRAAVLAMTDAFLAAGIPVTPEVGK